MASDPDHTPNGDEPLMDLHKIHPQDHPMCLNSMSSLGDVHSSVPAHPVDKLVLTCG